MDYTYSYSGADCDAYAYFDDRPDETIHLNSLATISISLHEAKSPVRRLGNRNAVGYTSSTRTIAGSMIFLVIEDHPLAGLLKIDKEPILEKVKNVNEKRNTWSRDTRAPEINGLSLNNKRKLSTLLLPFNIRLFYKSEIYKRKVSTEDHYDKSASLEIKNIHIVNEGIVSSINDLVTEVSIQFVAEDLRQIDVKKEENISIKNSSTNKSAAMSNVRLGNYSLSGSFGSTIPRKIELNSASEEIKKEKSLNKIKEKESAEEQIPLSYESIADLVKKGIY